MLDRSGHVLPHLRADTFNLSIQKTFEVIAGFDELLVVYGPIKFLIPINEVNDILKDTLWCTFFTPGDDLLNILILISAAICIFHLQGRERYGNRQCTQLTF